MAGYRKIRRKRRRRHQQDERQNSPATATRVPDQPQTTEQKLLAMQRLAGNRAVQQMLIEEGLLDSPAPQTDTERTQDNQTDTASDTPILQRTPVTATSAPQQTLIQRGLFGWVKKTAKSVGSAIKKGAGAVGSGIKKGVGAVGSAIKKGASTVIKAGKSIGGKVLGAGKSLVGKAKSIVSRVFKGAKTAGKWLLGKASRAGSKVWGKVQAIAGKALQKARKFLSIIKGKAGGVLGKVKGLLGKAAGFAKSVLGKAKKIAGKVWTGTKWVSKQLWSKMTGIYHRVQRWRARLPKRVGRLLGNLWDGVKSLKPWSIKWWQSLGKASTWMGFLKWMGTNLVYVLEIAGVGEVYETAADFIKFNTRQLTGEEIEKARSVFGSSIDYNLVRVDDHAIIGPSFSDRAYVSFHTINSWGDMTDHTLLHELTHVWQYEDEGAMYMPRAIHAQEWGDGYDYGGVANLQVQQQAGNDITMFNPEQQAQIIGDFYHLRASGGTDEATLQVYAHFVRHVSTLPEDQLVSGG